LIRRLDTIVNTLQTEEATDSRPDACMQLVHEEAELLRGLHEVQKSVEKGLKDLVSRLTELDGERMNEKIGLDEEADRAITGFVPWKGPGVNRLLVKLDFGRIGNSYGQATNVIGPMIVGPMMV